MSTNPYAWAQNLQAQEAQKASQRESTSQQMLMNLFQEEANRQRPYVTMPARLAESQFERQNAEPFAARAAMRRYKQTKDAAAAGDDTSSVNDDGSETIVVGGKSYVIPATKKAE